MSKTSRVLLFFVLPILAVFLYPPKTLLEGALVLIVALAFFIGLGVFLWQGRSLALTFCIFVQGVNVIVRLMMFFSNSFSSSGEPNFAYLITCLAGLGLSIWLLLRLDRQDVHLTMIR
jgi:hypothetical protein